MFSTLRTRFGIPGVISVIALVFAMLGGAYAASNSSNAGKATASAKAKKGPRGPKGPKGDTGPAGPQGPAGPAGPAGAKGDAGANGSNGAAGAAGPTGPTGKTGATGASGQTGFTETLPKEKTETGTWASGGFIAPEGISHVVDSISFTIPLAAPSEHVVLLKKAETEESTTTPVEGCEYDPTDPTAVPVAPAGTLCVFTTREGEEEGTVVSVTKAPSGVGIKSDSRLGAYIWGIPAEFGKFELGGTWAVTAAE